MNRTASYTPPRMLLVDGLDGSGKQTISSQMERVLTKAGYRVFTLDPPYYDSPAGKLVSDYLTRGYGQIKDRSLTSFYYTLDRMNFLRDHFDDIFSAEPHYDFVIANRWALSSLLYQTTVFPQMAEYTAQCTHKATYANAGDPLPRFGRTYTVYLDEGMHTRTMNLEELYQKTMWYAENEPYGETYRDLSFVLNHVRAQLVREHANMLYRMEIMPWWLERGGKCFLPFANFQSVVLVPDIGIARDNMLKRAGGDNSKLDNNESSMTFLESVIENVRWIRNHESLIFAHTCPDAEDCDLEPITSVEGAVRAFNRHIDSGQEYFLLSPAQLAPVEPVIAPARSFEYVIINTCSVGNSEREGRFVKQKTKAQVLQEVWSALRLNAIHQLTADDLVFPDN